MCFVLPYTQDPLQDRDHDRQGSRKQISRFSTLWDLDLYRNSISRAICRQPRAERRHLIRENEDGEQQVIDSLLGLPWYEKQPRRW